MKQQGRKKDENGEFIITDDGLRAINESYRGLYIFTFKSGIELSNCENAIITFQAVWNTGGEHCIQIYPINGIIVPVNHKVTWLFKNGYCPRGGNGDGSGCTYSKDPCSITGDCCQYIQESKSATKPDTPVRNQYDFLGWNPSDDAWKSVTTDLSYEALWTESGIIWVYSAKDNKWEKKLKPHKYGNNESTNGKGGTIYHLYINFLPNGEIKSRR